MKLEYMEIGVIKSRIESSLFLQHNVRPMVRGKVKSNVEFGAKTS